LSFAFIVADNYDLTVVLFPGSTGITHSDLWSTPFLDLFFKSIRIAFIYSPSLLGRRDKERSVSWRTTPMLYMLLHFLNIQPFTPQVA